MTRLFCCFTLPQEACSLVECLAGFSQPFGFVGSSSRNHRVPLGAMPGMKRTRSPIDLDESASSEEDVIVMVEESRGCPATEDGPPGAGASSAASGVAAAASGVVAATFQQGDADAGQGPPIQLLGLSLAVIPNPI